MLQEEVEAVRRGGGAKAERAAAEQMMGVAALWLGEASPAAELVPVNPIHWSLTRQPPAPRPASNAFGGGYFVNAESIPGSPELHSTIDGTWDVSSGAVRDSHKAVYTVC